MTLLSHIFVLLACSFGHTVNLSQEIVDHEPAQGVEVANSLGDLTPRIFTLDDQTTIDDLYFMQDEALDADMNLAYLATLDKNGVYERIKVTTQIGETLRVIKWNRADVDPTTRTVKFGWWESENGTAIGFMTDAEINSQSRAVPVEKKP